MTISVKHPILSVFDMTLPEEDHKTYSDIQLDMDTQTWRGRASLLELSEGPGGAGGNADGSGDPIDTYHDDRGPTVIGPESICSYGKNKK